MLITENLEDKKQEIKCVAITLSDLDNYLLIDGKWWNMSYNTCYNWSEFFFFISYTDDCELELLIRSVVVITVSFAITSTDRKLKFIQRHTLLGVGCVYD